MLTYAIFFAFFSCTLTPWVAPYPYLKKNYLLGFAFYSPITKRTRCVSLSYSSRFFVESLLCTLRVHLLILSGIHYAAGDIMMVAPKNPADDVEQFLTLMQLNPNDVITLTPNDRFTKLPKKVSQPCTWRSKAHFDILI